MKGFFALAFFVAYVCLVNSMATKEISDKLRAATKKCITEHKVDPKMGEAIIKFEREATTENERCAVMCYMTEMGYIKDGKFSSDAVNHANKLKWDNAEIAERATTLFTLCMPIANPNNEHVNCLMAATMLNCVRNGMPMRHIPVPVLA